MYNLKPMGNPNYSKVAMSGMTYAQRLRLAAQKDPKNYGEYVKGRRIEIIPQFTPKDYKTLIK